MRSLLLATATISLSVSAVSAAGIESGMEAKELGLPATLQLQHQNETTFTSGYRGMTAEVKQSYPQLEDPGLDVKEQGIPSSIIRG